VARIRTIKPELWEDEAIGALPRDCRLLFIGLIQHSDDEGRQRGRPHVVKSNVFPYDDDVTADEVDLWLSLIASTGAITRYVHGGQKYLHVTNFNKHQAIQKPTKSKLPPPGAEGSIRDDYSSPPVALQGGREGKGREEELPPAGVSSVVPPDGDQGEDDHDQDELAVDRPEVAKLCDLLADALEAQGAGGPRPNPHTKKWHDAARRLLDLDGASVRQVEYVITWATSHHFWAANIRSMPKLREKWAPLVLQIRQEVEGKRAGGSARERAGSDMDALQRIADEQRARGE